MNTKTFEGILKSAKFMVNKIKRTHYIYKHKDTEDYFYTHLSPEHSDLKEDIYVGKVELQNNICTYKKG